MNIIFVAFHMNHFSFFRWILFLFVSSNVKNSISVTHQLSWGAVNETIMFGSYLYLPNQNRKIFCKLNIFWIHGYVNLIVTVQIKILITIYILLNYFKNIWWSLQILVKYNIVKYSYAIMIVWIFCSLSAFPVIR